MGWNCHKVAFWSVPVEHVFMHTMQFGRRSFLDLVLHYHRQKSYGLKSAPDEGSHLDLFPRHSFAELVNVEELLGRASCRSLI